MGRNKYRLDYVSERVLSETKYFLLAQSTLAKTARFSCRSTSTIYRDFNEKLPKINAELYREVRMQIERNKRGKKIANNGTTKQKNLVKQNTKPRC